MKIKFLVALFFVIAFTSLAFSQTVVLTPKKVIYKRPKPLSQYKKSFSVIRPKVSGVTPTIARKIETAISYEKNFDFSVKDEIGEIQWLEEASYAVDYNKNGILGITLSVMGSGAYPSESSKPVIVNLKTGEKVSAKDVFIKLSELAAKGKQTQKIEIKKGIAEIKKENPDEENPATLFENADFTVKNLEQFSVSDKGVTFWYDYGFPHVIQAWQPEGRHFFSWAQLKPFIKPDGLLGKFVR
jgi:hypothetical protein